MKAVALFWVAAFQMGCVATAQEQPTGAEMPMGQPITTASATPGIEISAAGQSLLVLQFAEGRSLLSTEARRALDSAAPQLIRHMAQGGLVIVLGSYDPADRPDEIPALAARRAEVVATYLHEAWGIDPRRLQLRQRAAHPNTLGQSEDLARRVEVFLVPAPEIHRHVGTILPRSLLVGTGHLDLDDFGGAENPLPGMRRP